jgi:hypothetical protein
MVIHQLMWVYYRLAIMRFIIQANSTSQLSSVGGRFQRAKGAEGTPGYKADTLNGRELKLPYMDPSR